jgi:hypothetical protein
VIYLIDGRGHLIGPFENREDIDRFIGMMALCGENWADYKIVAGGGDDAPGQRPTQVASWSKRLKSTSKLRLVGRRP